jgi:hypothetical protein
VEYGGCFSPNQIHHNCFFLKLQLQFLSHANSSKDPPTLVTSKIPWIFLAQTFPDVCSL